MVTIGLVRSAGPARGPSTPQDGPNIVAAIGELPVEDARLVAEIEQRSPQAKVLYVESLKKVNRYIQDARQTLDQDPNNEDAAGHLREAYSQKAMLYRMAVARSLE